MGFLLKDSLPIFNGFRLFGIILFDQVQKANLFWKLFFLSLNDIHHTFPYIRR